MPIDKQMKVFLPGTVADRPDALCCKVWNWDSRWSITWQEDGKEMGAMSQFHSFDPDYLRWLNGRLATADYTPRRTDHFFSCNPSPDAHTITITAQDPYGNVYKETVKRSF